MSKPNLRYSQFAREIDVDEYEQDIGFEVLNHARGFDNGHCPDPWGLHKNGDTTGKFGIHRDGRTFSCFVCGGGSLLSLTMALKDLHEEDAIDYLYQFARPVDKSNEDFIDEIDSILLTAKAERPVWPYFNLHVLDKWRAPSKTSEHWFSSRGIDPWVVDQYLLGYDHEHVRKSRSKGEYVGRAIILPHYWRVKLVGWQVRWLDEDRPKWIPKYTNTHDFPREKTLYNYEQVYFSKDPIVVVESIPTVLFLTSLGIAAVSTFGSNVSEEQIRLLRLCQQGIVLAPDNDKAGKKWVEDSRSDTVPLAEALSRYVPVRVTEPVPGEGGDLGDLVSEPALVKALIEAAEYYYPG